MKKLFFESFLIILMICPACTDKQLSEDKILFDFNWKFATGDHPGAEKTEFNDSQWKLVDIPHDFSIEQPFDSVNPSGKGGGYAYSGIGWYRKHFRLPAASKDKKTVLLFNGIYRNSEVWINGHYLGFRPYGYTSFYFDISEYLTEPGQENILSVKVNTTEQPNSRWYTGAGIYRHVWLIGSGNVHFRQWGVFARTEKASDKNATVRVSLELINERKNRETCKISTLLFSSDGKVISKEVSSVQMDPEDSVTVEQHLIINNPELWSIEHPNLYTLQSTIRSGKEIQDVFKTRIGVRTFHFSSDSGFFLNGKHVKLKGTNNHHDGGPLGAACMDQTFERQLRILKSMGSNALRMSHNPPAPELLDCADSMGFVVIDEIFDEWLSGKTRFGYSPYFLQWYRKDVENWIRRDRNHPSVIAWSLGNEVPEQRIKNGRDVLKMLMDAASVYDTTRPYTAACNDIWDANENGFSQLLDIVGYNYQETTYDYDHEKYPDRIIFGTETVIYPYHPGKQFPLNSYEQWLTGQLEDWVAGEFLWTGFDYLGESGIGAGGTGTEPWRYWPSWPWRSADCGVVDICGFEKPAYWFRKALWSDEPVVYLAVQTEPSAKDIQKAPFWGWPEVWPHWNHSSKGDTLLVHVYTNHPEVELLLNEESLGTQKWDIRKEAFPVWKVPYEPGTLEAIGTMPGGSRHSFALKTAGNPSVILLTADRKTLKANKQDLAYVIVQLTDDAGNPAPFARNLIQFDVSGPGRLRAVGNGDQSSHTPFNGQQMETYHGRCLAIIQSGVEKGEIIIKADGEGLKPAEIKIRAE
jgi:beta-galactosidase